MKYGMTRRGGITAVLSACLCILLIFSSAATAGEENGGKRLLEQSVEAMGGAKAARGWTTMSATGILNQFRPGWGTLKANCSRHIKKPDKAREERDFSAYDHPFFYNYYLNGEDAWMFVNMMTREHPMVTKSMKNLVRTIDETAYYAEECDTFFVVNDVPDDSLFSGSSFDRVGVVDQGDTLLFDLSRETRLPIRRIERNGAAHVILSDYRETGGLIVPFHIEVLEPQAGMSTEYVWEEILFDAEINDAIFEENRPTRKE
jgi:hypothetical protein